MLCHQLRCTTTYTSLAFSMIDGKGLFRSVCVSKALGPNNVYWYHIGKEGELSWELWSLLSVCLSAVRWNVRNVQVYYNGWHRYEGEVERERERCHLYIILSL